MRFNNSAAPQSLLAYIVILLSITSASGQVTSAELGTALQHAKTGELNVRDSVILADAMAVDAIPALESKFHQTTELSERISYASALVKLRDSDDQYWNLLHTEAMAVLVSRIPDANFSPSQGEMVIRSPELQAWANAHHISFETAFYDARLTYPGKILSMADTGDARALPLLRQALQSEDALIVGFAARGLVLLSDQKSIPEIIAATRKFPIPLRGVIAEALVYFDDPKAQQAVDQLLPPDFAARERKARADGRGVFGYD